MITSALFFIFAGLAIACAFLMVVHKNPLYSAISLIGVFIALSCIYVTLAAPFIAAVQVLIYAGAIMVLVIFVIMLLNVEHEDTRRTKIGFLLPAALVLAAVLIAEVAFILVSVDKASFPTSAASSIGSTASIGSQLFTSYLLPFEITSILLLMAIVGAMTLARRTKELSPNTRVIPGAQLLALNIVDPSKTLDDATAVETDTTEEAARLLGVNSSRDPSKRD